ncbi:hypothetical protein LCGC14_2819540 [marine sediment metagenome]|uniref:Uncharacterized protein n=1 Tax=marine sediment metagenome TaxID=412755 RepID=A0A0F9AQU8_9ZZZZ
MTSDFYLRLVGRRNEVVGPFKSTKAAQDWYKYEDWTNWQGVQEVQVIPESKLSKHDTVRAPTPPHKLVAPTKLPSIKSSPMCPKCGSEQVKPANYGTSRPRLECQSCGKVFT